MGNATLFFRAGLWYNVPDTDDAPLEGGTWMVCAFSGHRPHRLPWGTNEADPRCLALKEKLRQEIEVLIAGGVDVFACGMAQGCDLYFAEAVLDLRRTHPEIALWAALPCRSQADRWTEAEQDRHRRLCSESDRVVLVQEHYTADCMHRRNRWLLDQADCLLTVYDGGPGGTAWTVAEARRRGFTLVSVWL